MAKQSALRLSFELRALLSTADQEREMPSSLRDFAQNERADIHSVADLIRKIEVMFRNLQQSPGFLARRFARPNSQSELV